MGQSELMSMLRGLLLLCIMVYGIVIWCRTLLRTYRKIKRHESVNTRQTAEKLFLSDGIVLVSAWVLTVLSCGSLNVSSIFASLLTAIRMTAVFIVLSALCIFRTHRHNQNCQ